METSEDPNKLASTLLDPTTTQPLLSKSYPVDDSITPHRYPGQSSLDPDDQTQFLQISYNFGPRPFKDLPCLILFALLVLATFGFGIFASVHRNPHHSQVSSFTYNFTSSSCNLGSSSLSESESDFFALYSFDSSFLKSLIWTLVVTFILSIPFVLFVLFLLKRYTKQIVYASLPFFVIVPVFLDIYWFVACTVSSKCSEDFPLAYRILVLVFVLLLIGLLVWIFIANWHRIELTVKIIGVASFSLSRNLGLFGVLPALTLGLLAYYAPIVVFLVFARFNGEVVPKEKNGEYYCVWKQDSWVPAYYTFAILTMLWSATAMIEAHVYVISGTIAQWYFSKDESGPKRSMRSALRNAFGPSSGTICFSGLLIAVVRMVRSMVDNAKQEDSGIVNIILRFCANTLLSAVEFVNKFTITFAAITGEAYCTSAKMTYELLKRNLLSPVFVETVSTRILAGIIFVLSTIYAILVFVVVRAASHLGIETYLIAALAWLLLMVVLGFFVFVLDNVIETVYVCYAIDRDRGEVCKQEVHDVYVHLPISRSHSSVAYGARSPLLV
ncbi:CTL-like protein DDB [Capsicum galapagoense]